LSFEAFYYVTIAVLVFARGRGRIFGLFPLVLIAGPTMFLLAPTWLLGYLGYHVSRRWRADPRCAVPLWLVSLALLPLCSSLEFQFRDHLSFMRTPHQSIGALLAAYAAAACFTVNVLAFNSFSERTEPLFAPFAATIRWLGSMTFALYLFHQPLLSLFTVYHLPDRSSSAQLVLLVGGTLIVVMTLGRFCENTKDTYKRYLLTAWSFVVSYDSRLVRALLPARLGSMPPVPAAEMMWRPGEMRE
jgi:peptidoglycan/LPS O-acetylase OafA/YrhL